MVFATVATYNGWSKIDFTIFTGVTAMILCLAFIIAYLLGAGENATVVLIEFGCNLIWWVFWLATAACMASVVSSVNGVYDPYGYWNKNNIRASCAFAWITWALWTLSTLLSFKDVKNRNSGGGGSMPTAATSNVAMV